MAPCRPLFVPAPAPATATADADLVLEPRFDGRAGEGALLAAILAGRAPRVEIVAIEGDLARVRAVGLPALEHPHTFAHSLEMVLARTIQIAVQATRDGGGTLAALSESQTNLAASPILFLIRHLARRMRRRFGAPGSHRERWALALRRVDDTGAVAALRDWRPPDFALLPHDGARFQADPFPFAHGGRTCVFFEDYPYATRKGVIAVVELDAAGNASPMRVVLERPEHLSYPFVFAHEGEVYMLPEMSAASRVQLFRADPFPDRWVADHVLIDGAVIADATLVEHGGLWYMFGTQSGDAGSSWDALAVFHAPTLFGPWSPHPSNPVLIDAGAARPAGAMWHEDGVLMRVAQDCRVGYGTGLAICRVDRLDTNGFAQTIVDRLGPPAGLGADRVHTLNRSNGVEAIDLHLARSRIPN